MSIQLCEDANEIDFGAWTGKTFHELELLPEWRRFNQLRSVAAIPGGEMMLQVQQRMVHEMERMRLGHPDQEVALFSHGDPIKAAIAHYAGIPLDLFHRIDIAPASISVLRLADYSPQILRVNDTGEL